MELKTSARIGTAVSVVLVVLVLLLRSETPPPARLTVVATIPPIHALVAGVMEGVGTPVLLLPAGSDPHHEALRPSARQQLDDAGLVVWVGPNLEGAIGRSIAGLPPSVQRLALAGVPGITQRPTRRGGLWQATVPGEPGADAAATAATTSIDPHLWLDPHNAGLWVEQIALRLQAIDPHNSHRYSKNSLWMRSELKRLETELTATLAPLAGRPYLVYHDAYRYFEERFGLQPVGAISIDADRPPGAGRLQAVREALRTRPIGCLFVEPGVDRARIAVLREGNGVAIGELDPLGAGLEPGPKLYAELLRGLAGSLVDCLGPG